MPEKCQWHDRCFDKIETQLADLDAKMDQALVRLADGSGVHNLLGHRLHVLERIIFGLVAIVLTIVLTVIISGYVKAS